MKEETIKKISYLLKYEETRLHDNLKRVILQGLSNTSELEAYKAALIAHDDWQNFCEGLKK